MKIALVEPKAPFLNFYSTVIKHLPLLGPIYLATILKGEGHSVSVHNENMRRLDWSVLKDADVLGISIMTATAPRGYEIAQIYHAINPRGRVIIGGSHATFVPEEAAAFAEHVITGEAEAVLSDVINHGGDRIIPGRPVEDLDSLPFPDYSLIYGRRKTHFVSVSPSRGCPHSCAFCSVSPMFGRRYRMRSPGSIIDEISRLKYRHIFFCDDNFAVNKEIARELLNLMIEHRVPSWTAQTDVSIGKDEELVKLMARAGCQRLCIGFESVNPETLQIYGKKQTPDDIRTCITVLHRHGIKVHGMFISEGYTDVYHRLGLDTLQLTILTPLVGSRLHHAVQEAGRLLAKIYPADWKLFDGCHVVHRPDNLSAVEMQKQTIRSLKGFYSQVNALKMLMKGRFYDFRIRIAGHHLIQRWEKQNRGFLLMLQHNCAHD